MTMSVSRILPKTSEVRAAAPRAENQTEFSEPSKVVADARHTAPLVKVVFSSS